MYMAEKPQISVVGSTKRNKQPKIGTKHLLHCFYSNFKVYTNFLSIHNKTKLAFKLATKQVSLNMIFISINEDWGRVKHATRLASPIAPNF